MTSFVCEDFDNGLKGNRLFFEKTPSHASIPPHQNGTMAKVLFVAAGIKELHVDLKQNCMMFKRGFMRVR